MNVDTISQFIGGANAFGLFLIALFFAKFWCRTSDQLFGAFAIAFGVMGVGRIVESVAHSAHASSPAVYLFRLLAFLLIIGAIVRKNLHKA